MTEILSSGPAVLLADEMGLGKTLQCIAAAVMLDCEEVLVVCPPTLRHVWQDELLKWFGIMANVPDSKKPEIMPGWNIIAYSTIWRESHDDFRCRKWDMAICDEAHALKSWKLPRGKPDSKAATAFFEEVAPHSERVIFSTGTPMPNRPVELWPMLSVLLPDDHQINRRWNYTRRYCSSCDGRWGSKEDGSSNIPELREKLLPVTVRRLKKAVLTELPDKVIKVIELPPTKDVKVALDYESGEIEATKESIEKIRSRIAVAKETGSIKEFQSAQKKLKEYGDLAFSQLAAMRNRLSIPKATVVAEYLRLLLNGGVNKVVVGYYHSGHGDALAEKLKAFGVLRIDGKTPMKDRGRIVAEFQEGSPRVFLAQSKAASSGLTLTAASNIVISETTYVPADLSQMLSRCHRIGQKDCVIAHLLCIEDSPDSLIFKSLAKKIEVIRGVIDGVKVGAKRKMTWLGKGVDPAKLCVKLGNADHRWIHAEMYRLHRLTVDGGPNDGKGFSSSLAGRAQHLALMRHPTRIQYADMLLLLCRVSGQVDGGIPAQLVAEINSLAIDQLSLG